MALHRSVVAIILGGGRGTRLAPLTDYRSKPAVPLGGKYRLVDVPISNCINSGVFHIFILTQYESASLNRHVGQTYTFDHFRGGFVEVIAAEQRTRNDNWFQGTADAVRQTFHHTTDAATQDVLILSGDALYRMDYADLMRRHLATDADITIASKTVGPELAPEFGILKIDDSNRIVSFVEKPPAANLGGLEMDEETIRKNGLDASKPYLASMGIYVFKKSVLESFLQNKAFNDFGKDIIPAAVGTQKIYAYPFSGYWEDIGTIKAFYEANLALTSWTPEFNLYDARMPIYTRRRFLPGAKILNCTIQNSILGEGAIITGRLITHSSIGIRSVVRAGSHVESTVMMGCDGYEETMPKPADPAEAAIPLGVGENCVIKRAILDLNVRIGNGVVIHNSQNHQNFDDPNGRYVIRDGIVILRKNAVLPHGTVI